MLIEQGMIFALGFLVALLLVLLFLPAFWNRAIRLSMRKIGERLPLSMAEVAAERDGLRAESAIRQRRLEQARDHAIEARDRERGTVGRLTARIAAYEIETDGLRLDVTKRDEVLIETQRALLAAEAELGTVQKDHYDAGAQLDRAARNAEAMHFEQQRLRDLADQRRMTVASLETRIQGMQGRIDDLESNLRDMERIGTFDGNRATFGAGHADPSRIAELEGHVTRLEAEKRALERFSVVGNEGRDGQVAGQPEADRDEIALLRKSIADVATEVLRLGSLRETPTDAPNVLQIRRLTGRDGNKSAVGETLQQGHGKSVGAS